jgi:homoserine dehydrogenase
VTALATRLEGLRDDRLRDAAAGATPKREMQRALVPVDVVLLGTGTVGSALLTRLARLQHEGIARGLRLVLVANSRARLRDGSGIAAASARERLSATNAPLLPFIAGQLDRGGIVIDATASDEVAAWHPNWLEAGLSVVTANKTGTGCELSRWRLIEARRERYGDAATVGAGLPLLRTLRELRAGGDRIHGIAGVLSGSLAWLFDHYDGKRPFSGFVREARALGYTEPDPRQDLSGEDVRRKLLILSRSAGLALHASDLEVESLLPSLLAQASAGAVDEYLPALDEPLRARFQSAWREGRKLRYIARLDGNGRARVGLEALAPDDPLAVGSGCDNRVAISSDRYCRQPLVIQGPGAGAEVTAAALLDDALRLAAAYGSFRRG